MNGASAHTHTHRQDLDAGLSGLGGEGFEGVADAGGPDHAMADPSSATSSSAPYSALSKGLPSSRWGGPRCQALAFDPKGREMSASAKPHDGEWALRRKRAGPARPLARPGTTIAKRIGPDAKPPRLTAMM